MNFGWGTHDAKHSPSRILNQIQYFWTFWERVWSNLSLTSKNLAHRLIHFKVIHRAYITPYKTPFKMKLQSNLNCHICNTTSSGTFLHMFWECPVVISLWTHVNLVLSSLLWIDWSVNPSLCLLNDDSGICISSMQKRMLFAGFTAVKKTIIQNWFTPHMCRKTYWIRSLLQIVSFECTTARVGGARPSTKHLAVFFVEYTWLYKGVTFVFLLSFPLPLPFDWTLRCWVCVCCFVLLYFGYYVVLCVKKKKIVDNKKKKTLNMHIYCIHQYKVAWFGWDLWVSFASCIATLLTMDRLCLQNFA